VFLNHQGSLRHKPVESAHDEAGRYIEKILNEVDVKKNLQGILDSSVKQVRKLRANHN
jgi:hypothetical protein